MSLRELTAYVVVFQLCVVAVVLAGGLGSLLRGGVRTGPLDVPASGDLWPELVLLLVVMSVTPYALYAVQRHLSTR